MLSEKELTKLQEEAKRLRSLILEKTSQDGGHVSSPLGTIEIILALLEVFDFQKDKITFDVGHYIHAYKILTDREDRFFTMDKKGGIGEYPNIEESPYDFYTVGHSGTGISAGLGYSVNHDEYKTISMIGDGSMTGGQPFEALNHAGELQTNLIVIYNDNDYSVTENVGFLNLNKRIKQFSESLGFEYKGVIDGHSFEDLIRVFKESKKRKYPIFIHIKTLKGKGYKPAEQDPVKFHWLDAFDIETGELKNPKENKFGNYMIDKAKSLRKEYPNLYFVSPAAARSTGLKELKDIYPDYVFDTGMNEQHCVTFSAALALNKNKVICFIPATFLPRCFDQIIDVCLQNIPVIFVLLYPGIGATGPTHQGIYTFPLLNMLPNAELYNPSDADQFDQILEVGLKSKFPIFIQKPSEGIPVKSARDIVELTKGDKLSIISLGNTLNKALNLAQQVDGVQVLYVRKLKPVNFKLLIKLIGQSNKVLILEDGFMNSGIGEHIIANILKKLPVEYEIKGVGEEFPQIGTLEEVYQDLKLGEKHLLITVNKLIDGKKL